MRKTFRSVWAMTAANLDAWLRSPRTLLMVLFVVAICYLQGQGVARTLADTGRSLHFGETLFYELNFGAGVNMTSILFLMMVSEIPRRIGFQNAMLIRATRMKWLASQLLYCLLAALFMLLFVTFWIVVFTLPAVTPGSGWSDAQRALASGIEPHDALISPIIRASFSPFAACLIAMTPLLLFWFTMVCVILLFSLFGASIAGVLLYVFLLVANVTVLFEVFPGMSMPVHYATLRGIFAVFNYEELYGFRRTVMGYGVLIAALIGIMALRVKSTELVFTAAQKE